MFGTLFLSEDWNLNLNFMWVPWQIWEHPWACFWIQTGFKSRLNLCGSQIYYHYWTHWFFSHFLSLLQTLLSLFLLAITEGRAPPYTAAARRHLAKLIAKKIPNQNLSSSTNKNTTRPKKKRDPMKKKLKFTCYNTGQRSRGTI